MVRKLLRGVMPVVLLCGAVAATLPVTALPAWACTAGLYQNVRYVDGTSWLGWEYPPQPPGGLGDEMTTAAVGGGSSFNIHVDVLSSNRVIWDNVEYQSGIQSGSWQGWEQPAQPPVTVYDIADAAEPDGSMQMVAWTSNGLYHNIRYANGLWQGWEQPTQPFSDASGDFGDLAATGMANGDMVVIVGGSIPPGPGLTYFADVRYANGSWSGWSEVPPVPGGPIQMTIAGAPDGTLQAIALNADRAVYHNIWYSYGSWQGWEQPAQPPDTTWSRFLTVAATPDGGSEFADLVLDPNVNHGLGLIYTALRNPDGSWRGWAQLNTPTGAALDESQGMKLAAPTWTSIGADEVWGDLPTFCYS